VGRDVGDGAWLAIDTKALRSSSFALVGQRRRALEHA
jgi:hypothetical protein